MLSIGPTDALVITQLGELADVGRAADLDVAVIRSSPCSQRRVGVRRSAARHRRCDRAASPAARRSVRTTSGPPGSIVQRPSSSLPTRTSPGLSRVGRVVGRDVVEHPFDEVLRPGAPGCSRGRGRRGAPRPRPDGCAGCRARMRRGVADAVPDRVVPRLLGHGVDGRRCNRSWAAWTSATRSAP